MASALQGNSSNVYMTHISVSKRSHQQPSVTNHVNKVCDHVQEASTLLSALAAALSNCHLPWPAFLPVHDPLRDAHWGIAAAGLATVHYDSDSIHLSKNPTHLQQVKPVYTFQQDSTGMQLDLCQVPLPSAVYSASGCLWHCYSFFVINSLSLWCVMPDCSMPWGPCMS